MARAPDEAWQRLAQGEPQDLIVVFDDATIREQAARLDNRSGISRDEAVIRFKAAQYAALKKNVLSSLPAGEAEVLRDYDALPLMFIRFRSATALKALLAHPAVLRAYEDRRESPIPVKPER